MYKILMHNQPKGANCILRNSIHDCFLPYICVFPPSPFIPSFSLLTMILSFTLYQTTKFDECRCQFNSLTDDKILDQSNFKALADDKNVTKTLKFFKGIAENILGKGENVGYQHFLLFPKCFQKPPLSELLKVGIVWERV